MYAIHFARNAAADDIDDAQYPAAPPADFLHRHQRIQRLPGLTDSDVQGVLFNHGIAISKLGCRFSVCRNAGKDSIDGRQPAGVVVDPQPSNLIREWTTTRASRLRPPGAPC